MAQQKNQKLGVVKSFVENGERVEVVRTRYKDGVARTYRRYPDRPYRRDPNRCPKNKRKEEAKRKSNLIILQNAPRDPFVQRIWDTAERWNAMPQQVAGINITRCVLRFYIATVMLNWSYSKTLRTFNLGSGNRGYLSRCLGRVEDARDEPWFDEFMEGIENELRQTLPVSQEAP